MKTLKNSTLWLSLAIVLVVAGWVAIGLALTQSIEASKAEAAAEVEESPPPEPEVIEVEVEVVPEACLDALDDAEKVFGVSAEGFSHVADLFDALDRDSDLAFNAALNKFIESQEAVEPHVDTYQDAARECREAQ